MGESPSVEVEYDADSSSPLKVKTGRKYRVTVKGGVYEVSIPVLGGPHQSATVKSNDGSYNQTVQWSEGTPTEDGVVLTFKGIKPNLTYEMTLDPGGGEPSIIIAQNVVATVEALRQHQSAAQSE